jgi:hypothetical protein
LGGEFRVGNGESLRSFGGGDRAQECRELLLRGQQTIG